MYTKDRSKYPETKGGRPDVDLTSGKFVKVWQGPNHPGITGNMSLELTLSGDEVVDCRTHVGYLHRGFEKLMERRTYMQCFPIVCRISVPEPDFNEYLFAATVEELAGIEVPEKADWLRTLSLEMIRLASFLQWIGGQAGAFGFGTIGQWGIANRDYILDLFEELTGGRIYHMFIIPGGVRGDLPEGFRGRARRIMDHIEELLRDMERAMLHNAVYKRRAVGLGILPQEMIDSYGVTGPNARAAGLKRDIRLDQPYLMYDRLELDYITAQNSDTYARTEVRLGEMFQSVSLIRQMLEKIPDGGAFHTRLPNPLHWKVPAGETFRRAECTRGEYGYYTVADGSAYPRRIYVRGPSYTHAVALMEQLALNVNVADIAGLMTSLHTYPPEIER